MAFEVGQPVHKKITPDMLNRIEAKAVCSNFVEHPLAPVPQFPTHLRVIHVQVTAHQVIEAAPFQAHLAVKGFPLHQPNGFVIRLPAVVVGRIKVVPVPLHARVGVVPPRKVKARPGFNGALIAQGVIAIARIHRRRFKFFLIVRRHFVVKHHISVYINAQITAGLHRRHVLVFSPVLSAHRPLLVKLPQVKQVIDPIAHIVAPPNPFVGRR